LGSSILGSFGGFIGGPTGGLVLIKTGSEGTNGAGDGI